MFWLTHFLFIGDDVLYKVKLSVIVEYLEGGEGILPSLFRKGGDLLLSVTVLCSLGCDRVCYG